MTAPAVRPVRSSTGSACPSSIGSTDSSVSIVMKSTFWVGWKTRSAMSESRVGGNQAPMWM